MSSQLYKITKRISISALVLLGIFWLGFFIMITYHMDTHFRADLKAKKEISFVTEESIHFSSIPFTSIDVSKFSKVEMKPKEELTIGEKVQQIAIASPFVITSNDKLSTVTIQPKTQNASATLEHFSVDIGTEVTLKIDENNPNKLEISLKGKKLQEKSFEIHVKDSLQLTTDGCQFSGVQPSPQDNENFTVTLKETEPLIQFTPFKNSFDKEELNLSLEIQTNTNNIVFFQNKTLGMNTLKEHLVYIDSIKVKNLQLFYQDKDTKGKKRKYSSLKKGEIRYVEYPKKEPFLLRDTDILDFYENEQFSIEKIVFNPMGTETYTSSIDLRIQGIATHAMQVRTESSIDDKPYKRELRLTLYDSLSKSEFVDLLVGSINFIIAIIASIVGLVFTKPDGE